jgi:hypothetical protein
VAKRRVHQGDPAIRNRDWSRMFFDAAKNPTDWLRVAWKLRSSADIIFEREKPIAAKALNELHRLLAEGKTILSQRAKEAAMVTQVIIWLMAS